MKTNQERKLKIKETLELSRKPREEIYRRMAQSAMSHAAKRSSIIRTEIYSLNLKLQRLLVTWETQFK